ncbi:hypothetical protein [Actinoplanes sp. M2I2]|uniref:hypothetical protein n=1 Tax=Actinoplanes sp. M2I2 TaxID=1734444 RepID=UPI0020208FEB|nr:hypothetical protein [Actinoplanes sp. M2I2]
MEIEQERLLMLAKHLREAAEAAGRTDVVAKVDDLVLMIADAEPPAAQGKTNVVLRILDGLGL